MKRHEMTDEQWERLKPLLPSDTPHGGGRWHDHRRMLNGMLWRLGTGAPWRDLPPRYGKWHSVYSRFNHWCKNGLIEQIALVLQAELEAYARIDWSLWCVDASMIRATRAAAGARHDAKKNWPGEPPHHALGRSRGGFSTKLHLICDKHVVLMVLLTPGQRHETKFARLLLHRLLQKWPEKMPRWIAGDKGYSAPKIRKWLGRHHVHDAIAHRKNDTRPARFPKRIYRQRNVIERSVGWLKEFRAVVTRFDKLARTFLGTVWLACIARYLGF